MPPRAMRARPASPACVLVTSGPGATNAVTGIVDALMDSIPMVVITGQVATHLIGTDAFQECDTVGITRPCTKHNYLVKDVDDLPRRSARGLPHRHHRPSGPGGHRHPQGRAVRQGRLPGPEARVKHAQLRPAAQGRRGEIAEAVELIAARQRPILYTGGGVINAGPRGAARCCASSPS